jgi:VWFA-related protein
MSNLFPKLLFVCCLIRIVDQGIPGAASALAQQSSPSADSPIRQSPAFQIAVRNVAFEIVVVDDHGNPVKGLNPSDLIVTEDGSPQKLLSFAEKDATTDQTTLAPQLELPLNTFADHGPAINATAMTVLLFDTSQLRAPDAAFARDQAAAFLKKTAPGTPMCVFDLDPWGLRLVQDFTTSASAIQDAIESRRNEQKPQLPPGMTPAFSRRLAIQQLARYLSAFSGRKNLIWFSGYTPQILVGRPRGLFPDVTTFEEKPFAGGLGLAAATLTFNDVAIYTVDPRGVVFSLEDLQFQGGGPAPYGFNEFLPQASTRFREDSEDEVREEGKESSALASQTGGKAFFDTNAIEKAVAEVVSSGSHYYSVSYSPANRNWNGAFRHIAVAFAGNITSTGLITSKLHLEYRHGYFAQDASPHARQITTGVPATSSLSTLIPRSDGTGDTVSQAMAFGAVAPFQVKFQAHITPDLRTQKLSRDESLSPGNFLAPKWRKSPFRNFEIHFTVNPNDVDVVRTSQGAYEGNIEFLAVVYDLYGNIVNSFDSKVPLQVNVEDFGKIRNLGIGATISIAIPTRGDFYVRLAVFDSRSGRIGALEIPVKSVHVLTGEAQTPATNSAR